MKNERFPLHILETTTCIGLFLISFSTFLKSAKEEAIKQRGYKCERCGKNSKKIYAHHILPKQMGGSDDIENLLLVCERCHPLLDNEAIRHGQLANGLKIQNVKTDMPKLIGNNDKYQKAVQRFSKRQR